MMEFSNDTHPVSRRPSRARRAPTWRCENAATMLAGAPPSRSAARGAPLAAPASPALRPVRAVEIIK